jgi:hypothetical protein
MRARLSQAVPGGSSLSGMDENPTVGLLRAYVERLEARDWAGVAGLLHPDVICRLPQTREIVRGRDAYLRWNRDYPDGWHLRLVEAYGETRPAARRALRRTSRANALLTRSCSSRSTSVLRAGSAPLVSTCET